MSSYLLAYLSILLDPGLNHPRYDFSRDNNRQEILFYTIRMKGRSVGIGDSFSEVVRFISGRVVEVRFWGYERGVWSPIVLILKDDDLEDVRVNFARDRSGALRVRWYSKPSANRWP